MDISVTPNTRTYVIQLSTTIFMAISLGADAVICHLVFLLIDRLLTFSSMHQASLCHQANCVV